MKGRFFPISSSFLFIMIPYGCTNVPMFSPLITFFKLPTVSISNTMIGSLFSLHMQVAVKSITFKPRLRTSS